MSDPFNTEDPETITISFKGGQNYKEGLFVFKGSPEAAAKRMGVENWDGKISSLLRRHSEITKYNDGLYSSGK